MIDELQRMLAATRREIVIAAERKLGRFLTRSERAGVESIQSFQMLEACRNAFTSALSTPAQILSDLGYLAVSSGRE